MILPRRKLLLATPALILPHRRAQAAVALPIPGPGGVSGPATPAWTLIAHTQATSGSSPLVSPAIDTTGANVLAWALSYFPGGTYTATDSNSNTWVQPAGAYSGTAGSLIQNFYVVASPVVGSGHTFTITTTAGNIFCSFVVYAFKSATGTPFFDSNVAAFSQASATSGTTLGVPSITETQPNSLVLAGLTDNTTGATFTIAPSPQYTIPDQVVTRSGGSNQGGALTWAILASGSTAPTWTCSTTIAATATQAYIIGSI